MKLCGYEIWFIAHQWKHHFYRGFGQCEKQLLLVWSTSRRFAQLSGIFVVKVSLTLLRIPVPLCCRVDVFGVNIPDKIKTLVISHKTKDIRGKDFGEVINGGHSNLWPQHLHHYWIIQNSCRCVWSASHSYTRSSEIQNLTFIPMMHLSIKLLYVC